MLGNSVDYGCGHLGLVCFNVDIHVAADLKALWLALGMKNFACPFCNASGKPDMCKIAEDLERRELSDLLGVPPSKVHLCALHACLRIVERLLKNSAVHAYSKDAHVHDGKRDRIKRLKDYLRSTLRRKKFVITLKKSESVGEGDADAESKSLL
jgi:hypothetical protein